MPLERGEGDLAVLPDAVCFPMKNPGGRAVPCRVTFNALALKARSATFLSEEEALSSFLTHRQEIEAAASEQYDKGARNILIGAAELAP